MLGACRLDVRESAARAGDDFLHTVALTRKNGVAKGSPRSRTSNGFHAATS
jgi:hypothetical protein